MFNCQEVQIFLFQLLFSQVDQQVGQFVTRLQERTLVTVVMTGRYCEEQHLNAATFVKITWSVVELGMRAALLLSTNTFCKREMKCVTLVTYDIGFTNRVKYHSKVGKMSLIACCCCFERWEQKCWCFFSSLGGQNLFSSKFIKYCFGWCFEGTILFFSLIYVVLFKLYIIQ